MTDSSLDLDHLQPHLTVHLNLHRSQILPISVRLELALSGQLLNLFPAQRMLPLAVPRFQTLERLSRVTTRTILSRVSSFSPNLRKNFL